MSPRRVSLLVSSVLLGWSAVANLLIGDRVYVARNVLLAVALLVIGRRVGLSEQDLGVQPSRVVDGIRWGVGAAGIIAVSLAGAVLLAHVVPLAATLLADERAAVSGGDLAYATLVRIPLGTAVFEEVAFRGVLLGSLLRAGSVGRAVAVSSVVFGLWHIPPTWVTLGINGVDAASQHGLIALAGSVMVTTIAGALFSWLRLRSGSLLAPVLAHWATNALGLLAAAGTGWFAA